jgi:secreted trypsin-like serine protease
MKTIATLLATASLALLSSTSTHAAESIAGSKPYVVSMRSNENEGTIAAGLLITPKHVLTLAQFQDYLTLAVVGDTNGEGRPTTGESFRVVKVTAHPNSSRSNFSNYNFLIAELERPSKFTPIALADHDATEYAGNMTSSYGWNKEVNTELTTKALLRRTHTVRDDAVCRASDFSSVSYEFNPTLFCAGGAENDAKCRFDTGGPIVVEREGKSDLALGSVLTGPGCGGAGQPGLFTRAYQVKSWIEATAPGVKFE